MINVTEVWYFLICVIPQLYMTYCADYTGHTKQLGLIVGIGQLVVLLALLVNWQTLVQSFVHEKLAL